MRIQIIGQKEAIDDLSAEVVASGHDVKPARAGIDKTEFAFGLGEIAAIVTLVAFALQLADQVFAIAQRLKAGREQVLRMKSSYGIVTLTLSKDVTLEQIRAELAKLEAK